MFYDFSMVVPFVLFAIALVGLFNGATALKTHAWSGFGYDLQGTSANRAGWLFLIIGTASLILIGFIAL